MPSNFETISVNPAHDADRAASPQDSYEINRSPNHQAASSASEEASGSQNPSFESLGQREVNIPLVEQQRVLLGGLGQRLEVLRAGKINTQEMYDLARYEKSL